ncbi:hypothetical protein CEXT_608611 [Caerostris extrusa]|uniref:Uncharacterized protein n=1 Tax=Caerostris extrusa TaxID=172846 RepID=A0AAV4R6P2_CAEEX|nr:hypothetical protein CEXT_608611 [Caerostris extrusa]
MEQFKEYLNCPSREPILSLQTSWSEIFTTEGPEETASEDGPLSDPRILIPSGEVSQNNHHRVRQVKLIPSTPHPSEKRDEEGGERMNKNITRQT